MAKGCGCAGSSCGCVVLGSAQVAVTGTGTAANPFVVTLKSIDIGNSFQVQDTSSLDLTLLGSGIDTDPFILSGVVKDAVSSGTWTPTLTGITLGTGGTAVASWLKIGRRVRVNVDITFGSTGFATSGAMSLTLPQVMADAQATNHAIGFCSFQDVSAAALYQGVLVGTGVNSSIGLRSLGAAGLLGTALPFTIGAGDKVSLLFEYPATS